MCAPVSARGRRSLAFPAPGVSASVASPQIRPVRSDRVSPRRRWRQEVGHGGAREPNRPASSSVWPASLAPAAGAAPDASAARAGRTWMAEAEEEEGKEQGGGNEGRHSEQQNETAATRAFPPTLGLIENPQSWRSKRMLVRGRTHLHASTVHKNVRGPHRWHLSHVQMPGGCLFLALCFGAHFERLVSCGRREGLVPSHRSGLFYPSCPCVSAPPSCSSSRGPLFPAARATPRTYAAAFKCRA